MRPKLILSCALLSFTAIVVGVIWPLFGPLGANQLFSIWLSAGGFAWIVMPMPIKQLVESIPTDPRWSELEMEEEWSDFLAIVTMIGGCLLATIP